MNLNDRQSHSLFESINSKKGSSTLGIENSSTFCLLVLEDKSRERELVLNCKQEGQAWQNHMRVADWGGKRNIMTVYYSKETSIIIQTSLSCFPSTDIS